MIWLLKLVEHKRPFTSSDANGRNVRVAEV